MRGFQVFFPVSLCSYRTHANQCAIRLVQSRRDHRPICTCVRWVQEELTIRFLPCLFFMLILIRAATHCQETSRPAILLPCHSHSARNGRGIRVKPPLFSPKGTPQPADNPPTKGFFLKQSKTQMLP